MEEKSPSKPEEKPFSVLERFRQLKKEKELAPAIEETAKSPETSRTVFQACTVTPPNEFSRADGFRRGRGSRGRGKRNFDENSAERPLKRIAAEVHQSQKESDVGITEFIREGPGFNVILKHRYTDFHVNEIDTEGRVVHLTSTEIPKDENEETFSEEEDPTLMTPEQWATLREIVDKTLSSTVEVDVTKWGKDQRQRLHKAVKRRFGVHVFSNTVDDDGRKITRIGYGTAQPNHRFCNWPRGRPEYLHFVLFKENCDMTESINVIGRVALTRANKIGYAGTKDKRAVTSQQVCVRRGDVNKFSKCSNLRGIAVGNYTYKWKGLRLGDLSGNRFRIALRHVKASEELIQEAVEQFKQSGFINYFGLQRFGQSVLAPTQAVGKAILKGDWQLATELILKPRPGEACFRDVKEAREVWWNTRDAELAIKNLTRKEKSIEGKILQGLKRHGPNAYQNAFDNLPKHSVTLYLHAYQSFIWNRVVSRRVQEFGLKVLPGDLVRIQTMQEEEEEVEPSSDDEGDTTYTAEEEGEGRIQVRSLTAEEAASASIYDVLYPLPGDDIKFPAHQVADWYTELLAEDGHSIECFRKVNKKYGMYGTYRLMMSRAEEVSWRTVHYSEPDEDLLLSDLDRLKGKPEPTLDPEGPYKALIMEFNLKVCSYATMAIRELAKCETSTSSQALLTNQAREEDLARKRLKLDQEMETDLAEEIERPNGSLEEQDANSSMETDEGRAEAEPSTPQNANAALFYHEKGEENKREAVADNIINKYLEINYH